MKLFLCSLFITPETKSDFEFLVGRPMKGLKIACITTASQGFVKLSESRNEKPDLSWLEGDVKKAKEIFGCEVDTFDIETMLYDQMIETFSKYDAIWVEGGMTFYLMSATKASGFDKALKKLLKDKIYIGTSAGSMICSKSLDASEWYVGEPEENTNHLEGIGLIDFQIYPHFDECNLEKIKEAKHPDQDYWLLKDGQAVSINDNEITVCGGEILKLCKMETSSKFVVQTYSPAIHKEQAVALFSCRPDIFPANEMEQITKEMLDLGNTTHCKFVCIEDETVLGYLGALLDKETNYWFLDWFSVQPNIQGKGVGSALLSTVEGWLQNQDVNELRVQTCSCDEETKARDFYTKKHFELENTEKDGYALNHSKLTCLKKLSIN